MGTSESSPRDPAYDEFSEVSLFHSADKCLSGKLRKANFVTVRVLIKYHRLRDILPRRLDNPRRLCGRQIFSRHRRYRRRIGIEYPDYIGYSYILVVTCMEIHKKLPYLSPLYTERQNRGVKHNYLFGNTLFLIRKLLFGFISSVGFAACRRRRLFPFTREGSGC